MRAWRTEHRLSGPARMKANARAYLHVYIKRGKVKKQPCLVCGALAEAHHTDYAKPLDVEWLCRDHRLQKHSTNT